MEGMHGGGAMGVKIGEFLVRIGVITDEQVDVVLQAQMAGDVRRFGEIAIAKGFMDDGALNRFTDFLAAHVDFPA